MPGSSALHGAGRRPPARASAASTGHVKIRYGVAANRPVYLEFTPFLAFPPERFDPPP